LYSLAATMYALATGQPPFVGDDPAEIMERQMREAFPDVRALAPTAPAAFQAVIARASEKRADKRFAGAEKMRAAVEALLEAPVEKPRPLPARPGRSPKPSLPSVSPTEATVVELESRLAKARKTSDSGTQLETLRSLYGLYAQLDRRDDALRAAREALAVHVKMHAPGVAANN
jgi:serine/threonine protein kinase